MSRKAASLPALLREQIWAHGEVHGLESTRKEFTKLLRENGLRTLTRGECKAVLNVIWRTEGARILATIPKSTRDLWLSAMLRTGLAKTAAQHAVAPALILRVCRGMRSTAPLARRRKERTLNQAICLAEDGNQMLAEAKANGFNGEWYRPTGEFSRKEFTGRSRATRRSLRAAFELLRLVPPDGFDISDQGVVAMFLSVCDRTIRGRKGRCDCFNEKRANDARAARYKECNFDCPA